MKNTATIKKETTSCIKLEVSFCPGLIRLSNRITLLCFALIGLKKPVETLARSQEECDMAELWRAEPGGGEKNSDAVNYAVVGFVMDVRSASLFLVLHPSSQVHCERYY